MSKITEQSVKAFRNGESFKKSNTRIEVEVEQDSKGNYTSKIVRMFLFNNLIAKYDNGRLSISAAGWKTKVTKERLNGLLGVKIYQKDHTWYLGGEYWDGEWIEIK
jgi:hypothetical protein